MAKVNLARAFSTENRLFDDLDQYREFCIEYGYKFNEADLLNMRSYSYQQFSKFTTGKNAKNMWEEDARRLNCNI